jgi:hypothetical protein
MAFIKHVGKHNNRKIVILYREVPGEEHMALIAYTDTLPSSFHDSIMNNLESNEGQTAESLSDVLFRNLLPDGRSILQTMHKEGFIKKVQTNQIIVTPTSKNNIRLDELNNILNGMATGKEATEKMKELDDNAGLVNPRDKKTTVNNDPTNNNVDTLSDESIASDLLKQSQKMAAEAEGLLAESKRLEAEAYNLNPALKPKRAATKKAAPKKRVAVKAKA